MMLSLLLLPPPFTFLLIFAFPPSPLFLTAIFAPTAAATHRSASTLTSKKTSSFWLISFLLLFFSWLWDVS